MISIKNFQIIKLFGHKDICISFKNPTQIYIGENGMGKTTLLNSLYYLLSLKWEELTKIPFETVSIELNKKKYDFHHIDIEAYIKHSDTSRHSGFSQYLSDSLKETDIDNIKGILKGTKTIEKMHAVRNYLISKGFVISASTRFIYDSVVEMLSNRQNFQLFEDYASKIKEECPDLLFFPTYRRIERNISSILSNLINSYNNERPISRLLREEIDELSQSSDKIHYGMQDIDKKINEICEKIRTISREKLDALSIDILKTEIRGEYLMERREFSNEDINKLKLILNRQHIGLEDEERERIWTLLDERKIYDGNHKELLYLLGKLLVIYDSYEEFDKAIKEFSKTCNNYLFEKKFVFDESSLRLKLFRDLENIEENDEEIALDKLSSGEKQIISLFAEVYLNHLDKKFIFLIDEPEISLSIHWQRTLLPDIMKSGKCELMLAVTHSPFIFDNNFEQYTMGMQDFMNLSKRSQE